MQDAVFIYILGGVLTGGSVRGQRPDAAADASAAANAL
jgi:hypothetical protein